MGVGFICSHRCASSFFIQFIWLLFFSFLLQHVSSQDNRPPKFSDTQYIFSVLENATIGDELTPTSPLTGILATDDEFDNITYEKVDLTDSPEITLDSISGVLEVAILLDREMTNSYSFDIRANDGINRGIQFLPIVTVQIVVLDVNDNMPVFVNPPYEFTIEEGVSDGHQVNPSYERISVTDKDIGNNQPSEFSIISGHDDRFMIDQNGNIITTLDDSAGVEKIIDYETKQVFDLVVRATNIEDGPAGSVFSEVNVTILILNINDEDPIFSASSVNQIISIPEAMSGVINTLQAMDTDDVLSIPTTFTYSIVYGNNLINGLHSFAIDPTSGDITVSNLDHETHDQYILVIQAEEDQSPKSSVLTSLTINIQDSNEYPPVFTQSNYEATISEASVVNSTVLLVLAEDSDPSHTVSYKPDGSADSMIFFLDSATGLITLLGSVDRDTDNMYTFEVIAVDDDPTPKSATATVTIYISDENDNSPTFTDAKQETHADEQILIIPHVIYDVAMNNMIMDDDEGVNSELKYSFQTGDSAFSIDPDTGFISVVAVLDFNTQSVYKLTIIATDQAVLASERRTGSFVLTVIVDDINDNSPVLASIGPQTIEENLPAGSIVFTVSATDLDQGLPTPLSLSIMDQTVPFSINTVGTPTNTFISAQISTNRMFDFENISEKSFSLTIQVSDGINTQYEIVIVTTEDTNDNSPVFSSSTGYTFSVNETETGKIIGFVAASDVDTSIFGPVTYVKTGDNEDYFQLDSTTGEISIQIALDAESLSVYRFSIVAFDSGLPPLSEIALVSINVLDFNDNSPIFLISHVEVSIDENTATPIIFTFVAKDMDRDAPNNIVKYFIVDSFPVISVLSDFFVIDEMTGIIQTGASLPNRENFAEITLTIEARDQGSPVMSDSATITISINDLNDNVPRFEFPSYNVTVDEDFSTSETLIQVHAFESPEDANTRITYSLQNKPPTSDDSLEYITIDSGTGIITASKSLDFEDLAVLELTITASDGINPATVGLTIYVENINDNAPSLTISSSCSQTLPENRPLGVFCTLDVLDLDQNSSTPEFTLESSGFSISPPLTKFAIVYSDGSSTASVQLQSLLDFESEKSYPLVITIVDRGRPSTRSATLSLPLIITGINEHAPVFTLVEYTFYMDEKEEITFIIGKVTANDADDSSTSDGIFVYTIAGTSTLPFTLEPTTGVISLNTKVDYEQDTSFQFTVHATDNAGGTQMTGSAIVTIIVEDSNEHPPIFVDCFSPPLPFEVSEASDPDELVAKVCAGDLDTSNVITFSIIDGNYDSVFRIDANTGEIFTTNNLPDFEVYPSYVLIVRADDNALNPREVSKAVTITILDVNDNTPVFDRPPVDSIVDEEIVDAFIMLVSATDLDSGLNAMITYSVIPDTQFAMDATTGILTTKMALDREVLSSYSPRICATDGGSPSNQVCQLVTIIIADVNDNLPVFLATSVVNVNVPENTNGGQVVSVFSVTDQDENPTFFFTLQDGGGPFSISSSGATATVTISGDSTFTPLDRESVDQYSLIVTVTDGLSSHITTHSFDVMVTDINDEIPSFTQDTYIVSVSLPEDSGDGTSVVNVVAVDDDIFPNNDINFRLLESADNRFRVDDATGEILVNIEPGGSILDYESFTSHTLIVESSDGTLTDTAVVYIPIGDVNDNSPIFLESSYSIQVLETTAVGTTILAVQAVDIDSGTNGEIKYFIDSVDADVTDTFEMADNSGILTTKELLDADSATTQYSFRIRAEDSATLVKSSFVSVFIIVLGQNEDIPEFNQSIYTTIIEEELSEKANFLKLLAMETDSNAIITYDIVDSGAKYYFNVNPTSGDLSLINPLDREEFEDFTFTVVASDSDSPPRQGFSTVKIIISDINDNPPIFLLSQYSVTISESTTGVIISITAIDSDATFANSEISYVITDSGLPFAINMVSGEISVSGPLDFDLGPKSYSISILAEDKDFSGITNLNIQLTDENDIAPMITNSDFSITIPESAPGGTEVFDVNIQDIDTVGTITYSISSGNTNNSFIIDSSGIVTISATALDFEAISSFSLVIEVSDGPHQASSTLTITVVDINDHVPTFDLSQYTVSILETNQPDTSVLNFNVLDPDTGSNGQISVFIDSSSNTVNMFKVKTVSPNSFEILSAIDLDRETSGISIDNSVGSAKWILKVIAYDNAIIISERLTSTAEILITLEDVNDNTPLFSSNSYSAQISESSIIGTLVITLIAVDLDFGPNAEVFYIFAVDSLNTACFDIDNTTGEVRTSCVLSREDSDTLVLKVEATDGSNVDSASVTITITDINDHNPVFDVALITLSIPENSLVGTFVTNISASDLDDGDNGRISILIIGGDPNSQFKINNINSGEAQVQVAKTDIDRELLSNYELILAARDHGTPTRQGTSTIRIDILDVNDNSPVFSPSEYFGTISEDATAGTPVVLNTPIVFSDLDDGLNSEVILSLDIDTIFSISPSYVISLIASMTLDREIESSFEIHIVAIDMGNPSLTSSATLSILVEDVNDNPPIFFPLSYSRILNEIVSVGTSVTTVFASDPDSGANMEISYHIFSGSQGNFDVNLASGLVQTTASLDRELTDSYDLVIIAFDSGSPFMTSTATVSIMIEDANDNMPLFTQSLYTGAVAENDSGSVVVILAALDTDINENAVLLFGFQDPIAGNILPFSIDSISGEMSVTGQLDRESTDIYSFDVVVRDNALIAMDRLTATANIVITINDVNDVAPSFPGVNSFRTSIQETTPITTIILSPIATDPDLGNGGNIKYSFSPLSTIFSVDVNTGEIRLIQSLDVDSDGPNGLSEYQITLVATDCGTPALSGSIPIIITVLNENDNVPIFDLPLYTVSVPENTSVDTVIITLIATDSDISGTIKYDIVGGNLDLLFSIDEDSGIVTNILSLFDLSNNIFELTVRAYESGDNSKSSLTSLHIQISDTNDNAPTFCQTADYQFTVNENSLIDTIIGQICGSDKDTGINGEFTFRIESGNDNNAFQIKQLPGSSTADITVANNTLNREIDDEYTLLLFITDNGIPALQSSPILVTIAILDVNDEIPTLDNLPFSIEVLEDAFGGTTIYQVLGSDSDSDSSLNADIFFNITDGNIGELFRIEPETGIITIIAPLNFNSQSEFTLTIQVSDKGLPPLFAQSTLQISIIDVNNHAPVFMPPYEISISEIFPMGSFVISVAATDQDATTNANLTYSISSGVNDVHFAIDNSGNITLNTDLDRETQSSYNLVVTACDMGTPMMCTSTQVTITITDNNDHVPVFSQPNYSFTVLEDRSADFKIGMVIATDLDEGVNGEVTYVFVSGDPLFSIDPNFGDILVDGVLDRETSDFYPLVIRAEDNGNPVLTALTNVSITVLDVNDNSPIIDVFSFSSQIREDAGFGELVFDVDVTDIDEGTNSRITLSILGGDFGDFFIIADTGSIHVNSSLSAEKIMQYELIIQAADGANPPRSDIQTLIIDIIDVNEFPPIFGQSIYYANLLEHSSSGTTIETVTASDFDVVGTVNSEISFFIPNLYSSDFAVDAVTGIITSIASFDREVSGSQLLVVMASNLNANPILQGSAEIQITIIDINDQIPYFINVPVTIEISELSPIGFSVLFLEALDDDDPTLGNGRVFFTSASENSAEFDRSFRINSDGLLEVNGLLDRENQQLYTAVAVVNDEGSPSLSSTTNIYIMLLDENDIPPLFSNSFYPIYYDEDLDPSSQNGRSRRLLTLEFTDADSVVDFQQSTFRLSSNSPFAAPEFSVTDSGELFLNIGLDRELLDTYTIFVEVINTALGLGAFCDPLDATRAIIENDQCKLYHNSTVQVFVTDINDNAPIFSSSPFYFAILDTVIFNSEVGIIIAMDSDLSTFGDILYSLTGTSDFTIDDSSGLLRTNVIFSGRVGQLLKFSVSASDQAEADSKTSSETVFVSVIDNQYLIQIVVDQTIENTRLCLDQLVNKLILLTNYQILVFDVRQHLLDLIVSPLQTDVLLYGLQASDDTFTLVTQSELIRKIDENFAELANICDGNVQTVSLVDHISQPVSGRQSSSVQIILIITVCVIILLCGFFANFLALYQRILGKRNLQRTQEYIYGGMEGLDVLTTTQQGGAFGGNALLSDAFPLGMTYESQELKMDLFLDEIPEEEFISGSELTNIDNRGSLLESALDTPTHNAQDVSISSI